VATLPKGYVLASPALVAVGASSINSPVETIVPPVGAVREPALRRRWGGSHPRLGNCTSWNGGAEAQPFQFRGEKCGTKHLFDRDIWR
jgi:hypothetical protein